MTGFAPGYESSDSQSTVTSSRSCFWALEAKGWSRWGKNKNEKRRDGWGDLKRKNKLFHLAGADSKERVSGNGRMEANALWCSGQEKSDRKETQNWGRKDGREKCKTVWFTGGKESVIFVKCHQVQCFILLTRKLPWFILSRFKKMGNADAQDLNRFCCWCFSPQRFYTDFQRTQN